jgi:hypothetical protein
MLSRSILFSGVKTPSAILSVSQLELWRSKTKDSGLWELEKPMNIIVSIGQKDSANAFITEKATEVIEEF